jgi:hypothetical protein
LFIVNSQDTTFKNNSFYANKPKLYCALSVSDGRLQPAFFASLVKNPYTLTGIDGVVKFEDVKVNRGQGYNPSTGVFTAPNYIQGNIFILAKNIQKTLSSALH